MYLTVDAITQLYRKSTRNRNGNEYIYCTKKKMCTEGKNHFHFDPAGFILMEQINSTETRWITRDLMCKTFALVCMVWLELCRAAHSF